MAYGLDAGIAIEVLRTRGGQAARGRLQRALDDGAAVWISSIVVHELITGALKDADPMCGLEKVDRLLSRLRTAELTADDAISAARVRADLEARGNPIGSLDMLIAGQALARGWTLATCNAHFLRVEGLTVIDWTRSDRPLDRPDALAQMLARPSKDPK